MIEDGADGFLCPDAPSIAKRLNQLLADASLRQRMGEAGRAKMLQKYTWTAVADRVRAVYEDVRAGGRPADALYAGFADGHRELLLCEAIAESHRRGGWVAVKD